jgi:Tfp pilus assembly protein PilF
LARSLESAGVVSVLDAPGVQLSSRCLQALLQSAAALAGVGPIIRLRGESEVALQCSLVELAESLQYPERHVRDVDHPRHGLLRYLTGAPQAVVWFHGLPSAHRLEEFASQLSGVRVVVSGAVPEVLELLKPRTSVMVPALDPSAVRVWMDSRLGETSPGGAPRPEATVEHLQCPTSASVWTSLLAAGHADHGDLGAGDLSRLAEQWWAAESTSADGWQLALWALADYDWSDAAPLRTACSQRPGYSHTEFDASLERIVKSGLVESSPESGRLALQPVWHAALRAALPLSLLLSGLEAWGRSLRSTSEEELSATFARHAERLAEAAGRNSDVPIELRESHLRRAVRSCRAVGAWRQGAFHAQRLVKLTTQRCGAESAEAAAAWRLSAEIQHAGHQLLAARKAARRAEEILERLGPEVVEALADLKCDIAELDLAEGRAERANHRLEGIRQLLQGGQPPREITARWMFLRGACLLAGKQLDRSELLLRRSWELRSQFLPPDHEALLTTRMLLARNLFAQHRTQDAEALLRSDLEIRRSSAAVTPMESAVTANLLADLYFANGRYAAAEPLLEEVLTIRRITSSQDDRFVGEAACRLASLKSSRGDYSAADRLFRQALTITENVFGEEHPRVADVLNELAKMLFTQSKHDQSRRLLERALAIQQRAYRKGDFRIVESQNSLAAIYVARGLYEHAARLYRESLAAVRQSKAGDHPALATTLNNLGDVLRSLGRHREGEELLVESLVMRQRLYGEAHPVVAQSLSNLAYLQLLVGRSEEARSNVERALRIRRETLGSQHPHTANSLATLGRLAWRAGDHAAAMGAFEESCEIHRLGLGDRSQQYGSSLALLGRAELATGRTAKAELHLLKSRVILEDTVGPNHRLYADALLGLAELSESEGRDNDAFPLLERALAIQKQTLGSDRYEVGETLLLVGRNLLRRGVPAIACERLHEAEKLLLSLAEPPGWIVMDVCLAGARAALENNLAAIAEQKLQLGLKWLSGDADDETRGEFLALQASVAMAQQRYAEAEQLINSQLEATTRRFGAEARELLPLLDQMAAALTMQNDARGAETCVRRSLAIAKRIYGTRHLETADRMDQLASLLMRTERAGDAHQLLQEVIAVHEERSQSNPLTLANSLQKQADVLHILKRSDDAIVLEDRAAALRNRTSHVLDDIL